VKIAILNVANGFWHPQGQDRLVKSLRELGCYYDVLGWKNEYPPGSPPHYHYSSPQKPDGVPYAFKTYAFEEARRRDYDVAIWCDASVWFVKHPQPLIDRIKEQGYWFCHQGWQVGTWCCDSALPTLGITREESFQMKMVAATFYGVNLKRMAPLLDWMLARTKDGSFKGPWRNSHHEASPDSRVMGHRHDQTALSVIVNRMGLAMDVPPCMFAYAGGSGNKGPGVIALAAGM
jgi:hypothetical protein